MGGRRRVAPKEERPLPSLPAVQLPVQPGSRPCGFNPCKKNVEEANTAKTSPVYRRRPRKALRMPEHSTQDRDSDVEPGIGAPDSLAPSPRSHRQIEQLRWLQRVSRRGMAFSAAGPSIRRDPEIALAAVAQTGRALQFVPQELKNDRAIVLAAVGQDGYALRYASSALREDREVVLTAVQSCGAALHFAADELQGDREVVLAAVTQNGMSLQFVDDGLKSDDDLKLLAKQSPAPVAPVHCPVQQDDGRWPCTREFSESLSTWSPGRTQTMSYFHTPRGPAHK
mmetsp:Transcript_572/g.1311  ORF Transcript_572/g.1311 Transcript_572/m.1311 type:complete len:283 (-) Transcript_572:90-938(-)